MHTEILAAAVQLSRTKGFSNVRRADIAAAASVAVGSINYHFDSMDGLRVAVIRYAVEHEVLEIVAQGLVEKHPVALKAPEVLRRKAARLLAG